MAPRATRGLPANRPGVKQESSIVLQRSPLERKLAPAYDYLLIARTFRIAAAGRGG
jgi:hypothetical protein